MEAAIQSQHIEHHIGGAAVTRPAERYADVTESATGAAVARVPLASERVVDEAVAVAAAAAEGWAATSISARTKVLFAFRELVHRHRDELARDITREHGKVLSDAAGEVQRGLEVIEFACGLGELLKGEMSAQVSRGVDSYSLRQPLGVVAGITPFNFPVMVPLWMVPVALACGNAFVLKPSEQVPSAAVRLAELLAEAGLPDGVFNVVHGDRVAVERLLRHDDVKAVSFVGSTPVARSIYATATAHGKRVQALGGAKNHAIVLPDADLALAADSLVSAGFGSAGQRCMAVSVAVAVGDVAEPLIDALLERIAAVRVGDGFDPASEMGPLVSPQHLDRVRGFVDAGVEEGAELLADGRDLVVPGREEGHFLGPCLFDRVRPGMRIYDEEIFGPVLLVVRAGTWQEAMALVAANPYGNGAAIFTNDG
ncbi:MAG TPA: CoA-acylating methylmalonate-semialdehyde dehydrogenase, partial [Capillimicrobium sp.]|nr:CoA-acylating methylmalonate-semialdehyde dehydrogenase [Capillimicrobium sp.]